MPKMKTNSAAKKRFSKTATGKFKRSMMGHRHLMTCKTRKTKRVQRQIAYIAAVDAHRIAKLLP